MLLLRQGRHLRPRMRFSLSFGWMIRVSAENKYFALRLVVVRRNGIHGRAASRYLGGWVHFAGKAVTVNISVNRCRIATEYHLPQFLAEIGLKITGVLLYPSSILLAPLVAHPSHYPQRNSCSCTSRSLQHQTVTRSDSPQTFNLGWYQETGDVRCNGGKQCKHIKIAQEYGNAIPEAKLESTNPQGGTCASRWMVQLNQIRKKKSAMV